MIIACPHCKKQVNIPDNAAGMQMRCPLCQGIFAAPRPVFAPLPPPAAAPALAAAPVPQLALEPHYTPAPPVAPIAPAPVAPAPRPAPEPAFAPADDGNPFAGFDASADGSQGGPAADLGFMEPIVGGMKGIKGRVRAAQGAWYLTLGIWCIIANLCLSGGGLIQAGPGGGRVAPLVFFVILLVAMPFVILLYYGARNLRDFGSNGLVIAGCVMGLVAAGGIALRNVLTLWAIVLVLRSPFAQQANLGFAYVSLAVGAVTMALLIVGPIVALRCLNDPEVQPHMKSAANRWANENRFTP